MPTWGDILKEINEANTHLINSGQAHVISGQDLIRRKYLSAMADKTKRPVILYATAWVASAVPNVSPNLTSIVTEDVHGLMEAAHGIAGESLDLIVHSPGGSPTAAEAMVKYIRSKFTDLRVIVPHMAMSAATMLACSADRVLMGKHSFLGPIDPQLIMHTALGPRAVPAQAIIAQFERAQKECADPEKLRAWLPMLNQYGPDLLETCRNASELSKQLVQNWLCAYMFKELPNPKERADPIGEWLAGHNNFLDHSRPLGREELIAKGLIVESLESDQEMQDIVLSIYHATSHTFTSTLAVKIIENHLGKAFLKLANAVQMPGQAQAN